MTPTLPRKITGAVDRLKAETWNALLDCVKYAMTNPKADNRTIIKTETGQLMVARPGGKSAAGGANTGTAEIEYFFKLYIESTTDGTHILKMTDPGQVEAFNKVVQVAPVEIELTSECNVYLQYLRPSLAVLTTLPKVGPAVYPIRQIAKIDANFEFVWQIKFTTSLVRLNDISSVPHVLAEPYDSDVDNITLPALQTDIADLTVDEINSGQVGKKLFVKFFNSGGVTAQYYMAEAIPADTSTTVYLYLGTIGEDLGYHDSVARLSERWLVVL